MAQDTNVQNLIINKLTKAQYEGIATPSDTELYLTPDTSLSAEDLKTINNTSLVGSGNISVQTVISDLSTIRSGASAGATALHPNDNISELTNNVGYITDITSSDVVTALGYTPYNSTNPNGYITASALNGYATESFVTSQGYITNSALTGYATENWVTNKNYVNGTTLTNTLADYVLSSDLSTTLSNYVTTNTTQTISGTKTYTGAVHFIGSGDNDAVFISTNTRFNIEGTRQTVLGFAASTFYVNHTSYELLLRGSGTRPRYNKSTLALTSDIPNTSNLANKDLSNLSATGEAKFQAPLVSGTNIKTINNNSILGSGNLTLDGLPTQTGNNGKFLTTDGTDASWKDVPCRNIGEIIYSAIPLTDAGLHLLDGTLINGSGIYSAFVDYIADLYAENPTANYFTDETTWQLSITNYGVCGKFVYDSVNNTVRLPKITGIIEGTTDLSALGDLVEAGLPNITGTTIVQATSSNRNTNTPNGAFASDGSYATLNGKDVNTITVYGGNFDASRSSSIYGNSNTVQPQTIKAFYYIVIATSTKTEIQVDIDEIATDLNGKVDKSDLAEVQCVVETYQNGTSGYWIRSDGYCEQWGRITGYSGWQTQAVTFLKPFKDRNYNITACHTRRTGSAYNDYSVSGVINPTTTGMSLNYYGTDTTGTIWWRVAGYIEV